MDAYAGYGFNKAHATSYGVLAYATAWFRANHPVAFWAGMLDAYADADMESGTARTASGCQDQAAGGLPAWRPRRTGSGCWGRT